MTVELHVSRELLENIGANEFEAHLKLFGATVVDRRTRDFFFQVIYDLDVPGTPVGATQVVPTFQNVGENGNVSVRLLGIEWLDALGRRIPEVVGSA